jgi:hypothetical protein
LLSTTDLYFAHDAPQKLISAQSVYLSLSFSLSLAPDICNVNNFCVCGKETKFFTNFLYQIEQDYLLIQKVKVKQSRYRPGVAQRFAGS